MLIIMFIGVLLSAIGILLSIILIVLAMLNFVLPIYLVIKSIMYKINLPFRYKFLYFFNNLKTLNYISFLCFLIYISPILSLNSNKVNWSLITLIVALIVFNLFTFFMNYKYKIKVNLLDDLEKKEWNLTKEEIEERFNFIENINFLLEEEKYLEEINNHKIFEPEFYENIFCEDIQQVYLYLNKKYGKYNENWNIKLLNVDKNKLIITLNNKEIIFNKI